MLILYLTCLIIFLIPICILITKQLHQITIQYSSFNRLDNVKKEKINNYLNKIKLAQIYIERNLWMSCITFLENQIDEDKEEKYYIEYYQVMGFCYLKMRLYKLAHYYYTKVINKEPENINGLMSIARIHSLANRIPDAINTYYKVLTIDQNNKIAKQSINILIKRV